MPVPGFFSAIREAQEEEACKEEACEEG